MFKINSDSDDSIDVGNKLGENILECGPSDKKGAECKLCFGTAEKNKKETVEPLIHCSKCLSICKNYIVIQILYMKIIIVYYEY